MFASSSFLLEEWLLRSTLAGGLLLLAGVAIMGSVAQPARRQRVGELALLSSLVVTGLCAFPAWMPYSLPLWPAPVEQVREHATATSEGGDDVEWVALEMSPEDLALLMELQLASSNAAVDVEGLPPAPAEEWLPPREVGHAAATAVSGSATSTRLWTLFLSWIGWAYVIVLASLLVRFGLATWGCGGGGASARPRRCGRRPYCDN